MKTFDLGRNQSELYIVWNLNGWCCIISEYLERNCDDELKKKISCAFVVLVEPIVVCFHESIQAPTMTFESECMGHIHWTGNRKWALDENYPKVYTLILSLLSKRFRLKYLVGWQGHECLSVHVSTKWIENHNFTGTNKM